MLIYTGQKSKQSKKQKTKQKQAWLEYCKKFNVKKDESKFKPLQAQEVPRRLGSLLYKDMKSLETSKLDTFKREKNQYTGTAMIGIASMHKSNFVPVFDGQHAVDLAKMRRG